MSHQYRRGRQAEYWARDQLYEDGYHTVVRAAGSKGKYDLVAIGEHNIKAVLVKRVQAGPIPSYKADIDLVKDDPIPPCAHKELWVFHDERKAWIVVPVNDGGEDG